VGLPADGQSTSGRDFVDGQIDAALRADSPVRAPSRKRGDNAELDLGSRSRPSGKGQRHRDDGASYHFKRHGISPIGKE
jgi:hypothetical protein